MELIHKGKTCIITGAAGAMGTATARRMAMAGSNVVLIDRDPLRLKPLADELAAFSVETMIQGVDLADTAAINAAMEQILKVFPQIHILANCAGISTSGPLLEMDLADYDREQAINCKAILVLARHVARNMIDNKTRDGRIISIASQSGKRGELNHGSYCISKAGVVMLTQVLGLELAKYGIAVTAISPGMVDTPMLRGLFKAQGVEGKAFEDACNRIIPMGRLACPEEIAGLVMYLSSKEAGYITGVTISIAGGTILT